MNASPEDRRVKQRLPASLMVQYASDSLALEGVATNLSPSGFFVESDLLDMIGTRALIQLNDGTWNKMNAVGEVVRTVDDTDATRPGMGIRFIEIGPGAMSWIEGYCEGFDRCVRVVIAEKRRKMLERASHVISRAGGQPLCVTPEILSVQSIERLCPHIIIVGSDMGTGEAIQFVRSIKSSERLIDSDVYIAGTIEKKYFLHALDSGVSDVIGWDEETKFSQVISEVKTNLESEYPRPDSDWLH